jgi:hypothetical protein
MQPEWEMKLLLPNAPSGAKAQQDLVTTLLDDFHAHVALAGKYRPWGRTPGNYDRDAFEKSSIDGFYAKALSSRKDFWHDGHKVEDSSTYGIRSELALDSKADAWTKDLTGEPLRTRAVNRTPEVLQFDYIVGHQFEDGSYIDTADFALRDQGIALRVKKWSPVDKDGKIGPVSARMLFLKADSDEKLKLSSMWAKQYLRRRDEYQVPIPDDATDAEVRAMAKALLDKVGVELPKGQKVGFITIDRFTLSDNPEKEYQQIEVEVLPEHKDLPAKKSIDFSSFVKNLISAFPQQLKVEETHTPKYLQGELD